MVIFLLNLPFTDTVFTILDGGTAPAGDHGTMSRRAADALAGAVPARAQGVMDHAELLVRRHGGRARAGAEGDDAILLLLTAISFIGVITGLTISRRPEAEIVPRLSEPRF